MVQLDPDKGGQVGIFGRKGSGKSVLARHFFDAYPYDRLVLDVTGDLSRDLRRDGVEFVRLDPDALPLRWPSSVDGSPVTCVLVPDMGDEALAMDQMDRAIGLALAHRRTLIWVDEIGSLTRNGKTPPNLRRALHHGRHRQITLMVCGPRSKDVDLLVVSQCDVIYVFLMPNPADRRRLAENIGWPPDRFDDAVLALAKHEFLECVCTGEGGITHYPPLPRRDRDLQMDTAA